jgi:hypothetical protein
MHRVYSNSFCNISAAGTEDSFGGLFYPRNPGPFHTSEVMLCVREFRDLGVSESERVRCDISWNNIWIQGVD